MCVTLKFCLIIVLLMPIHFVFAQTISLNGMWRFDIDRNDVGQDSHSLTDHIQGNWNGIVGRMEIQATPEVCIHNVQVYPDIDKQLATVQIQLTGNVASAQKINRKSLVERHIIINRGFDSLSSLTLGNGGFAYTVDITGLQSFPEAYARGVPLGTESEWAWHSFPNTQQYRFEETLKNYHLNDKDISFTVQLKIPERNKNAVEYFRQNPHRLQLGNVGLEIKLKDGSLAKLQDLKNIYQTLNMWNGEIHSHFTVENIPVDVTSVCHQQKDIIAVKIISPLMQQQRINLSVRFPYPTGNWEDMAINYMNDDKHKSNFINNSFGGSVHHVLDTTQYWLNFQWNQRSRVIQKQKHWFLIQPVSCDSFELVYEFSMKGLPEQQSFNHVLLNSKTHWQQFWKNGAAIDFEGSSDARAFELERRIILSQYLTKVQCSGNFPPQETGLTYNSWYGKPHLEMHWWHGVHFALWNRIDLLEKSMNWYTKVTDKARKIAERQGYKGVRWQKMTDPDGNESPSSVGSFLIWQQPHFIYFSELYYRAHPNSVTLKKYSNLVFATADFMASYAYYDSSLKKYILGKGVIAAQERFKAEETFNPTYELNYWFWALSTAQQWRQRLHLPRNQKWDDVLNNLSPLPVQNKKYLFTENATDSYINPKYKTDHPSVLGTIGMLPVTKKTDSAVMKNTFDWIWNNWDWKDTWGWDFPMVAMTATRLGLPDKAVDALLMPIQTNTYLNNGHNYQDQRLTIYLPGNGGLLTAIAMMCAGYDGCKTFMPGIPKNNTWKVKFEGLQKMP
jgi:hypothetical protein